MEQIRALLQAREKYLLQLKKQKQKTLAKAPEGSLRICRRGKNAQYYQRLDPKDFNGKYIKQKEVKLAGDLAQKDYDQRVLRTVEEELRAIEHCLNLYPTKTAEEVYESLCPERQTLTMPIRETDEQFVKEWLEKPYVGKEIFGNTPEYYTFQEERVRSKSEVLIANMLYREGIPYKYECPVYLDGWGNVYPDFTVLNVCKRKEIFWEHLGMMDNAEYAEKAIAKICNYERNGIYVGENLILTYETQNQPLNQRHIKQLVQHHLQ